MPGYWKESKGANNRDVYTPMFIAALFTTAKIGVSLVPVGT